MKVKKFLGKFVSDEKGSEVVEFVMALPVVLQLIAAAIFTLQLIFAKDVALNAASLGCRAAIVQEQYQAAKQEADSKATIYVDGVGMGVRYKNSNMEAQGAWERGNLVDYTVSIECTPLFPFGLISKPVDVPQTATMMIEK